MNPHDDKNTLVLFLFQELTEHESQTVKEHVRSCETCGHELTLLQETLHVYRQLPLEVPRQGILTNVLWQKSEAAASASRIGARLTSFFTKRQQRWAIVMLSSLSTLGTLTYVVYLLTTGNSSPQHIDLAWKSSLSDSLKVMSRRVSLFHNRVTTPSGKTNGPTFASTQTIEAEMLSLKERITHFSTSIANNKF